ncbi:MAG TPA: hypothetical protein VH393_10730 [Ktedonobacterales bacterium]
MATRSATVEIGKIVRSDSHVRYTCQIFGPGEHSVAPEPDDYAFGTFVRVPLRRLPARADVAPESYLPAPESEVAPRQAVQRRSGKGFWAVGLIYDTILLNPAFGSLGPRLNSEDQNPLFSPDYLSERAVLVSVLLLGTALERTGAPAAIAHGVPPIAPELGAVAATMSDAEIRAFHIFADGRPPGGETPYLHMGYLPHAIAQENPLLPVALLHTVERLERLCPENAALLSLVKRNFAWRQKVEATG